MTFTPTPEQEQALQAIERWYADGAVDPFVLAGLAGTGKTACLPMLKERLAARETRWVAPSWKASANLTRRLRDAGVPETATSIHNFIYAPTGIDHDQDCAAYTYEARQAGIDCDMDCRAPRFEFEDREGHKDLIVVDETSMVPMRMIEDLMSLGHPMLLVGDHGQLPPVKGASIFTHRPPDFTLNSIQRQVEGSPIIALSRMIRDGDQNWLRRARDELGFSVDPYDIALYAEEHRTGAAVFLAYRNTEVDQINAKVRRVLGFDDAINAAVGDRVMLRDNAIHLTIYNGEQGTVEEINGDGWVVRMDSGKVFTGRSLIARSDLHGTERQNQVFRWNWSYACTTHKMQGSEAPRIVLKLPRRDPGRRWLYTSVTRSSRDLHLR